MVRSILAVVTGYIVMAALVMLTFTPAAAPSITYGYATVLLSI